MATQGTDTSHRDDGMTAGGPGADSQNPPAFGAPASGTANNSGDTPEQSASDSGNTSAQQAQTSTADSSQPANAQASSPDEGQDTANTGNGSANTSGNGSAPAADNSGGSAGPGNGDASASAANSGGSASAADSSSSAGAGNGGSSAGPGDSGSSATAENSDGSAGAGGDEHSALHLAGAGSPLQPIFDAANGAASDVTGSSGILQGLVDLADTVGIGAIGATPSADGHSNLITDLVNFPGDAVGGNLNPGLSNIFADLSDTADAATGMVGDVLGGNTGGLVSNDASGASGLLHPATDLTGSIGNDLQSAPLIGANSGGGLLSGSVGDFGSSSSGDALHADAGSQSNSDGLGIGVLTPADSGHTAGAGVLNVGSDGPQVADVAILSTTDPLNAPALNGLSSPSLIGTDSPSSLLTVNGGNNAGDGGVTGAAIGDLNGSSSGHLVDLAAGPHGDHDSSVGVLAAQPNSGQAATASAVDVGPGGPQLADAGVLTNPGALNIASLNGVGTDSLAGNLLSGGTAETAAGALQPTPIATNLGEVHDVPTIPVTQDHGIVDVNHAHII